jgi:PAS domain S-box-containing protein
MTNGSEITELRALAAKQPHLEMVLGALDRLSDPVIIADPMGIICFVNMQAELVFSYSRDELIGKNVEVLLPETLREGHIKFRTDFWKVPRVRSMGAGRQLKGVTKDGREFPCEIMLSPYTTQHGRYVSAQVRVL